VNFSETLSGVETFQKDLKSSLSGKATSPEGSDELEEVELEPPLLEERGKVELAFSSLEATKESFEELFAGISLLEEKEEEPLAHEARRLKDDKRKNQVFFMRPNYLTLQG